MKNLLRRINATLSMHGFSLLALVSVRYLPQFVRDARDYRRRSTASSMPFKWRNLFPVLVDKRDRAGATTGHYFIMDLFMGRRVIAAHPKLHLDVGSSISGFVAHLLAANLKVTMLDIRPLPNLPEGLSFKKIDATTMKGIKSNSVASLSTLHVAEHFGLGRYGDPIDPDACYTYMRSLARVLAKKGKLYFATPVGRERVEFNAHRVFNAQKIENLFKAAGLKVVEKSFITTPGKLLANPNWATTESEHFGCGLWVFTK